MKLVIAGNRDSQVNLDEMEKAVWASGFKPTEIVSGAASGIDRLGELWAEKNEIPIYRFPAQWETYGKSAGPKRNKEMAAYGDALLAIWDGKSPGTRNMIENMTREGKPVKVFHPDALK